MSSVNETINLPNDITKSEIQNNNLWNTNTSSAMSRNIFNNLNNVNNVNYYQFDESHINNESVINQELIDNITMRKKNNKIGVYKSNNDQFNYGDLNKNIKYNLNSHPIQLFNNQNNIKSEFNNDFYDKKL